MLLSSYFFFLYFFQHCFFFYSVRFCLSSLSSTPFSLLIFNLYVSFTLPYSSLLVLRYFAYVFHLLYFSPSFFSLVLLTSFTLFGFNFVFSSLASSVLLFHVLPLLLFFIFFFPSFILSFRFSSLRFK